MLLCAKIGRANTPRRVVGSLVAVVACGCSFWECQMRESLNPFLLAAGISSALAAIMHLLCIAFGGAWYRALGAGERMARMAEAGHHYPIVVTGAIALMLFVWALYAASGAGLVGRLPLLRIVLCLITFVYLGRGIGFGLIMKLFPGNSMQFWWLSSGVCLAIGLLHLLGLRQVWHRI